MDDLDAAVALVYAQPPPGFVAARAAVVKELKAAKRKDDAAFVASLRRPTKLAWAIGEAFRRDPEAGTAFFSAIDVLAGARGDLRQHTADLRRAVTTLVEAAEGVDPGDANAALLAIAADPAATNALRRGRLADVPAAGGFGGLSPGVASPGGDAPTGEEESAGTEDDATAVTGSSAPADAPGEAAASAAGRQEEERARAERLVALEAAEADAAAAERAAAERLRAAQAAVDDARAELARASSAYAAARAGAAEAAARLAAEKPG